MRFLKSGLLMSLVFLCGARSASASWNYSGTVAGVTVYEFGRVIFKLNTAAAPPSTCTGAPQGGFTIVPSNPGYKDQLATLMLAYSIGSTQSVSVIWDGSGDHSDPTWPSLPMAYRIILGTSY